jgi:hypothetical protein
LPGAPRPLASVYQATLPPFSEAILCDIDAAEGEGRAESEVVVDPELLRAAKVERIETRRRPAISR